ncbi:sugar ABC transporter ATP-binding protein [Shimazuella sp. AN120528]|uniref:sugar ABC transporter ATP-binding protein n=1 Tax=Shimazuella soli TaxID=1892854 RepID=UPI001F0DC2B0|nr:sugar ABC transporter ATP-binding protein [Shimazuella soli]MCH5584865.1 sugar ABC transporter ATP-binding protein [Shimazuella soli]
MLQVKQLDKRFGHHYALLGVSLDIKDGEIHALVGENGAGKSTLIKILTGIYSSDGGNILLHDKKIEITEPKVARKIGIQVVHQDRQLINSFTGYENLFLGLTYPTYKVGFKIRWKAMKQKAEQLKTNLGISLDLGKLAEHMTPSEKTMLEIMRAAMLDCRLLILDEPTAALNDEESELLFDLINKLVAKGTSILYVSHRMNEILRLSHRVTVMRNGKVAGTYFTKDMSKEKLVQLMTDQTTAANKHIKRSVNSSKLDVLQLEGVSSFDQKVQDVSLHVKQGEIVGIFGLAGSGRTELLETIYGTRKIRNGKLVIKGRNITSFSPKKSLSRGVILIPEDRRADGLILNMSVRENMTLSTLPKFSSIFRMKKKKEQAVVHTWMGKLQVKAVSQEQPITELSGGNQQKVVFAKALLSDPILFLCDEPTQAVDVMTREEIHRLLIEQAKKDAAVLLVSSDVQEVLDIADRIYVLHEGKTVAEFPNKAVTSEQILQVCYNQRKQSDVINE